MKPNLPILMISIVALMFFACEPKSDSNATKVTDMEIAMSESIGYDSLLAKKYGADDYGMKKYVMAFLKRGPNRSEDSVRRGELQRAHLQNINRLAEEKKLVIAGPFFGDGDLRGISIFDVPSIEEAVALTNTDPAIQAGSLEMELLEWYGPAGLLALEDIHKKLTKKEVF